MKGLQISDVRLKCAPELEVKTGLVGYISLVINDAIVLDGITLRRSSDGRPYLSYPGRSDRRQGRHPYVRPVCDPVRREIERQVFRALGITEAAR